MKIRHKIRATATHPELLGKELPTENTYLKIIIFRAQPWVSRKSESEPEWSWAWQLAGQKDGKGPGHPQYKELTENYFL